MLQLHWKEPTELVQMWSHPPLLVKHSFTSGLEETQTPQTLVKVLTEDYHNLNIPLHESPLLATVYPLWQLQTNDPTLFVHV